MLVKTTQYKSSGISSANLLRALEIFDLPPAISPELNKCPGSNPVNCVNSSCGNCSIVPDNSTALEYLLDDLYTSSLVYSSFQEILMLSMHSTYKPGITHTRKYCNNSYYYPD